MMMMQQTSEQAKLVLAFVHAGMSILSARIAVFMAMIMAFSLACWTMYDPTYNRIMMASIFGALVFLPVLSMDKRQAKERELVTGE